MELTPLGCTLLAFGVITLGIDAFAIRRVLTSPFYESAQRWAQTVLVLFVPIFGACFALYLARKDIPLLQSPPEDHVKDIDPFCSDIDCDG